MIGSRERHSTTRTPKAGWAPRLVHGEAWRQVSDLKPKELLDRRYERLMSYGRFNDTKAER